MLLRQRTVALRTLARNEPARISVAEKVIGRIAYAHFVPHTDSHRCAFLRVDRLAAQVFLIEAQVHAADCAEKADEERMRANLQGEKMQAGLVDDADHASEEQKNVGFAFLDDGE